MAEEEPVPFPQPKIDPESLVLRGRPRPVARFRRSVVIGSVVVVSATLITLTWLALEPVTFKKIADGSSARPFEQPVPETLAATPRDYHDVPKLGPPLPGDLGRPILEQQRQLGADSRASDEVPIRNPVDSAAVSKDERVKAEEMARASSLVVQLSDARATPERHNEAAALPPSERNAPPPASPADPRLELGDWSRADASVHSLTPPASRSEIAAGTIIPASLLTGLNSDLPGMVLAQITENVRDSATGRTVLIPQGARLIGRYDSSLAYGQKRAFVLWQRIVFPDGSSLRLDNMPASDAAGYAGLTDRVDGHSWQLIKGVMLSSLLGVGTQLSFGGEGEIVRALRESMQQSAGQAGGQIISKGLSVAPTVRVRPGWPVRVLVSQDLVLQPWKG